MNLAQLRSAHADLVARGRSLDLTRGKPATAQLDLSNGLLELPAGEFHAADGTDLRNYGGAAGLAELREIFAELLAVEPAQLVALGNSSLALMHATLVFLSLHGASGQPGWREQALAAGRPVRLLCPSPGYDRHFALAAHLGIELVGIELGEHGPDVDEVARLATDPLVKGIWVVPTYANPTGTVYDEETARALCAMPAAPDFRILWDNAYALHHLTGSETAPLPIVDIAAQEGHPDRVVQFASTSKITFAGGGVAFLSGSEATVAWFLGHEGFATIGPDKVNQLRHVRFFGDADGVRRHMERHRAILAPKFAVVDEVLSRRLAGSGLATWTRPEGGYFVTLSVRPGTATRVVALAREAGVALTPAGSSHPYGRDPQDAVIRLAPSFPPPDELREAMEVVATCVLLAAAEAAEADGAGRDAGQGAGV